MLAALESFTSSASNASAAFKDAVTEIKDAFFYLLALMQSAAVLPSVTLGVKGGQGEVWAHDGGDGPGPGPGPARAALPVHPAAAHPPPMPFAFKVSHPLQRQVI